MKVIYSLIILIVSIYYGYAQIPNQGFETWNSMGSYENPAFWGTMNNTTASDDIYTATKGTPGNPGSFYLKLTSQTIGGNVINGVAVSGVLDTLTMLPRSGFPYIQRPQSFGGKWQHMIFGSSQGSISVYLTRWNNGIGQRDTIATACQKLSGMAMSWAAFTINFVYQSALYPDTCIIFLAASGASPTQDDYLWVDDLILADTTTGLTEDFNDKPMLKIFPNPADKETEICFMSEVMQGDMLQIFDSSGKMVRETSILSKYCKINTAELVNGQYYCRWIHNNTTSCNINFIVKH